MLTYRFAGSLSTPWYRRKWKKKKHISGNWYIYKKNVSKFEIKPYTIENRFNIVFYNARSIYHFWRNHIWHFMQNVKSKRTPRKMNKSAVGFTILCSECKNNDSLSRTILCFSNPFIIPFLVKNILKGDIYTLHRNLNRKSYKD